MAKNDTILIDGIIDARVSDCIPSEKRDEVFEYFAFEQILKDYGLSEEELLSGNTDGRDDGGIDGFYIFVNGHYLQEAEAFVWPRRSAELDVWVITCKLHNTFEQAPLDKLAATLTEVLDLSLADEELRGSYSEQILELRRRLLLAYRKLSPALHRLTFHFAYTSRGDSNSIGEAVNARSLQVAGVAKDLFGACETSFHFFGSAELVKLSRRVPVFSLELKFLEYLSRGERYIALCRLEDFKSFVTDEAGNLRRYLFDSNVRDFMGPNHVNEDMLTTLRNPNSPDFWWLNNGITILATAARVVGKAVQIEGVQIVNGLQTTEAISRFFDASGEDPNGRAVLVKLVVSEDPIVRDAIIRATNNQTEVSHSSLRATDEIQRNIEDVFEQAGLHYERRKNYHINLGCNDQLIVTPLYVAAGVVSLCLKSPFHAVRLRSRFMRKEDQYASIFSDKIPLQAWPQIAKVLRMVDSFLKPGRQLGGQRVEFRGKRVQKEWRQLLALIAVARLAGRFSFGAKFLVTLDLETLNDELLQTTWDCIVGQRRGLTKTRQQERSFVRQCCKNAESRFAISDANTIEARPLFRYVSVQPLDPAHALVEKVHALLPKQPWPVGVHREVASTLSVSPHIVQSAIQTLISEGRQNTQVSGVVYSADGTVLLVDESRLPPTPDA